MIELDDIVKMQNDAVAAASQQTKETTAATEQKTETPPVTEQKTEEKTEVKEGVKEEIKDTFFEEITKRFNRSYKTNDELEEVFKKADSTGNYGELEKKMKEYEEAIDKMKDFTRPDKWFGSPEKYKTYKLIEKFSAEGKDPDIVNIALTIDNKKINDLEAVTLDAQLNNSSLNEIEAAVLTLSKIGVEIETEGDPTEKDIDEAYNKLTLVQKARLKDLSATSRKNLEALKNTEIPEAEDYFKTLEERNKQEQQKRQERENTLKESWKPEYDKIRLASEKIKIPEIVDGKEEIFEFSVDKETLVKLPQIIEKSILQANLDPTPENIELAKKMFIKEYLKENWEKVWSAGRKDLRSKLTAEFIQKTENPTSFSTSVNTSGKQTDADVAASQAKAFGVQI